MASWLDHMLTIPVVVVRASRMTDVYGQDLPDWEEADYTATRAWLQASALQAGTDETMIERDQQRADLLAWFPGGTDIIGQDRVIVGEDVYEVNGPPAHRRPPWADVEHHVQADLRRVWGPGELEVEDVP